MTQSSEMPIIWAAGLLLASWLPSPAAQTDDPVHDPVMVTTEHPRLFLRPQRLRLLKRERERTAARWQQFELFMAGKAPMPERGLAEALYYQVSGNADAGRRAVAWALGPGLTPINDLRQQALVFDWCQDVLSVAQRRDLAARLQRGMADTAANESMTVVRSRVLAAVALFDHVPQAPQRELERVVRNWWFGKMAPALKR